jgi:ADP-ribose pyrophosphatase YjhB (NUDIX family)
MNYCPHCGAAVVFRTPPGDTLPRHVCTRCETIHYQNPKVVVGSIVEWEGSILLCRRAIEPRHGKWTLPAGFMEMGETMVQGAARETAEEAGAEVEMGAFFSAMSIPRVGQVHVFYLARLLSDRFDPGQESLEARLFAEDEVPWDELAFTTVRETLKCFFADHRRGQYGVHDVDIA